MEVNSRRCLSMVTALEVPADMLIEKLARYLKERVPAVKPPQWAYVVKTGVHKEKPPMNSDWWYFRAASLLRKLYKIGRPVGIERLRTAYGGLKDGGSAPSHFAKGSGSIVRKMLQQLELAGLVARVEKQGRTLTPQGRSLLDSIAFEVARELAEKEPEFKKYIK